MTPTACTRDHDINSAHARLALSTLPHSPDNEHRTRYVAPRRMNRYSRDAMASANTPTLIDIVNILRAGASYVNAVLGAAARWSALIVDASLALRSFAMDIEWTVSIWTGVP